MTKRDDYEYLQASTEWYNPTSDWWYHHENKWRIKWADDTQGWSLILHTIHARDQGVKPTVTIRPGHLQKALEAIASVHVVIERRFVYSYLDTKRVKTDAEK